MIQTRDIPLTDEEVKLIIAALAQEWDARGGQCFSCFELAKRLSDILEKKLVIENNHNSVQASGSV